MQRRFSKSLVFNSLVIAASLLAMTGWLRSLPDRLVVADAVVMGDARAVAIGRPIDRLVVDARLWRLTAPDPRFHGLSALAVDGADLIALTDAGVVVRFAPPLAASERIAFRLHDLPAGPGPTHRKAGRDSESLVRDPLGRGWWVGFENRHSLWLFDRQFGSVVERHSLDTAWSRNKGAEALVAGSKGRVFALPERGGRSMGDDGTRGPLAPSGSADATRLPDGRLALLVRRITVAGFVSEVRISAGAEKPPRRLTLPLDRLANAEAIAAAPNGDGGTRLWIATDDNFKPWMRTYLLALDLAPGV